MEKLIEIKDAFNSLYRRILREHVVDRSNWTKIGEQLRTGYFDYKVNILVNDESEKPDLHNRNTWAYKNFVKNNVAYIDDEGDNRGEPGYYDKVENKLDPKYKGTYWDWFLNGLDETKEQEHEYFMSQLDIQDGMVVLKHNSPYKIEDGFVGGSGRKGPNSYSNNSDLGNYFWGSKEEGSDQSSAGEYQYICYVPVDEVYDFEYNEKGYSSMKEACLNEKYVASWWPNGGGIVVVSRYPTKIDHVIKRNTF